VELFNQTNGQNWVNNENWLTNEPVDRWFGVKVHGKRVMELSLDKNNLSGELTDTLTGLDELAYLSLYRNQVSGNPRPSATSQIYITRILTRISLPAPFLLLSVN
jgi:hypothetical protein